MEDRSVDDPGAVYDPVPTEDQFAIIDEVLKEYNETEKAAARRSTRNGPGPTIADLRAELERTQAEAATKVAEYQAREAESKADLEQVEGRLKAIENMMRAGFGANDMDVGAVSEGASFIPTNFINLP